MKFKTGIKISVPASVANVCCGFDALGFALNTVSDEIIVRKGKQKGIRITVIRGDQGKLSKEILENTAGIAAQATLDYLIRERGVDPNTGIALELRKKLFIGSGLGSSAASAVAGTMAINECFGRPLNKRELLNFALQGEQLSSDGLIHADNVAPSLLGGFILARDSKEGDIHRLPIFKGLHAVVVSPRIQILTKTARNILKQEVPLSDAIQQAANLGSLILAFYNTNLDLLKRSLKDHLVEKQRAHLIPHFYEVQAAAINSGALGCSISGSGPAVFALCANSLTAENTAMKMAEVWENAKIKTHKIVSLINHEGAILE